MKTLNYLISLYIEALAGAKRQELPTKKRLEPPAAYIERQGIIEDYVLSYSYKKLLWGIFGNNAV